MLRSGSVGSAVEALQSQLASQGYSIAVDGIYGPGTERAVRDFQRKHDLAPDGIVGPKTISALEGYRSDKILTSSALEKAALDLGVSLPAVLAINEVESRGLGFLSSGLPVILYERHIMWRRLTLRGVNPQTWARRYPNLVNQSPGGYRGNHREHDRLETAKAISVPSAIESASWGLFQIMGMHWERLGYDSATSFEKLMNRSEADQLDAFVRFIKADPTLHRALKRHDWKTVARLYNGPAYEKNSYDTRMAAAYERHRTALEGTA